jgi:hypothetical protein
MVEEDTGSVKGTLSGLTVVGAEDLFVGGAGWHAYEDTSTGITTSTLLLATAT